MPRVHVFYFWLMHMQSKFSQTSVELYLNSAQLCVVRHPNCLLLRSPPCCLAISRSAGRVDAKLPLTRVTTSGLGWSHLHKFLDNMDRLSPVVKPPYRVLCCFLLIALLHSRPYPIKLCIGCFCFWSDSCLFYCTVLDQDQTAFRCISLSSSEFHHIYFFFCNAFWVLQWRNFPIWDEWSLILSNLI